LTTVDFSYYCYRCGEKNTLEIPCPEAPDFHHQDLTCKNCGDGTRVLMSHCPHCSRYVYWINDLSIPDLVQGFAKYMIHNMQKMIERAAQDGVQIDIDTTDKFPINATCPCGHRFSVDIPIPDLD
jgi:hypothetical protein